MSAPETLAYWQGGVDQTLKTHSEQLRDHDDRLNNHSHRIGVLEVAVGKIAVKIGIGATLGSIIGGGLVAAIARVILGP